MWKRYEYIVFLTDVNSPRWSQQVIQQSDCVLLLDHNDLPPEKSLFDHSIREILVQTTKNIHLIILYNQKFEKNPNYTTQKRISREKNIKQVHHVVIGNVRDLGR